MVVLRLEVVSNKRKLFGILNQKFSNYNIVNSSVIGSNLVNNFKILENIQKEKLKKVYINFSLDDLVGLGQLIEEEENNNNKNNLKEEKPDLVSQLKKNKYL